MHESSLKRMEWFADNHLKNRKEQKVLDVGSFNVNGCYREIFLSRGHMYTGLDMEAGPNVDIIPRKIYEWDEILDDTYDVVITGQAIEHIEFFWVTIAEIVRITKKDGLICVIAPCGFGEHRYPVDCWRFYTDGMVALARYYNLKLIHAHTNSAPSIYDIEWFSEDCSDTMMIAQKTYKGKTKIVDLSNYKCIPEEHRRINSGFTSYLDYKEIIKAKSANQFDVKKKSEKSRNNNIITRIIKLLKNLRRRFKDK